jgi:catechol 2,3-dioxygenase-like lactoylglutathione lyase family enzyme
MITGVHLLLYTKDAEADRVFFQKVLGFPAVDAGGGWLIFGLPPSEMGIHPGSGDFVQSHADQQLLGAVLYLMCADLNSMMRFLRDKKVECSDVVEARWGITTTICLPSGGRIGLYQPKHETAFKSPSKGAATKAGKRKPSASKRRGRA